MIETWTIYDHPRDYPNGFIARKSIDNKPTFETKLGSSLESVRKQLPPGLTRFERDPSDDAVIVETWF